MNFPSSFIIPSFALLTVLFYAILRAIVNSPSRKKTAGLNKYLKKTLSKIKSGESVDYEVYSQEVNNIINTSDLLDNNSILAKLSKYKQSPHSVILRAKLVCIFYLYFILMIFYIPPLLLFSYLFNVALVRTPILLLLVSLGLFVFTAVIVIRFGRLDRYSAANEGNIITKLKKVKGYVNLLEPKTTSATYYEPELKSKFYLIKVLIKVLIFGLIITISYLLINSIVMLQELDNQSFLKIIQFSFVLISLFGFILSIFKFKNSKYENFSLFFLIISIYALTQLEFSWIFAPLIVEIALSLALAVLSLISFLKNRRTQERAVPTTRKFLTSIMVDFLKRNLYNLVPLLFLIIDTEMLIRFLLNLDDSVDLLISAGYVILFILSLKSLIFYLKYYSFIISGIFRPRISTLVYRILVISLFYSLIPHIFIILDYMAYILVLSSNLIQLSIYLSIKIAKKQESRQNPQIVNVNMINERKEISKRGERELQRLINSKLKDSEHYTRVAKDEYELESSFSRISILRNNLERVEEEKIIEIIKNLEDCLKSLKYVIIPKKYWTENLGLLDIELLAVKVSEVSSSMSLLTFIPISITKLNGRYIISEHKIFYEPKQQKDIKGNKKIVIEIESYPLKNIYSIIMNYLRNNASLCGFIENTFNLKLSVHESKINLSKFKTFFKSGSKHIKVIIDSIIVSHQKPGFFNQNLPLPYIKQSSTYFTQLNKLSMLLKYLENKYTVIESVIEDNNFLEYEHQSNEKYYRNIRFVKYIVFILILYFVFIIFLWFILPDFFFPNYEIMLYISEITIPLITSIYLVIYFKYLKSRLRVVVESCTPYFKRGIDCDDRTYNYILELQPKELIAQFNYEYN